MEDRKLSAENDDKVKEWLSKRRCSQVERKEFDKSIIVDKPIIWVMGPTGAGKGTQCTKLHLKYGLTHLSPGELMRLEIIEGTDRSKYLCELMKSGRPVPNSTVIDVISQAIVALAKESKGFVIDGFPLNEEQASEFVEEFGAPSLVLQFDCNRKILKERLTERNNYNDTTEAIVNRFKTFTALTKPVLEKYDAVSIDAANSKEEVNSEIERLMMARLGLCASFDE